MNKHDTEKGFLETLLSIFTSKNPYDVEYRSHNPAEPVEGRGNFRVTSSDFGDRDIDSDDNE